MGRIFDLIRGAVSGETYIDNKTRVMNEKFERDHPYRYIFKPFSTITANELMLILDEFHGRLPPIDCVIPAAKPINPDLLRHFIQVSSDRPYDPVYRVA
jgi:hypothetical protein